MKDLNEYTMNMPYDLKVARGHIPGAQIIKVPGLHEVNVPTAELGDISLIPNVITAPRPIGSSLEVLSSNGGDSVAGGGIESICIRYLDVNGNELEKTLVMTGVTPVDAGTDIYDVQWMHAGVVAALGDVAIGNISLRTTGGAGTTYEYIGAGGNQSLTCRYKIPLAKKGYIANWDASSLKQRIDFKLRADVDRSTRQLTANAFLFQDEVVLETTDSGVRPGNYLSLPALSTVKVSGRAGVVGAIGASNVTLLLIDDNAGE